VLYMWTFVQTRLSRAEEALLEAWTEVRLLHVRLPQCSITAQEAADWLEYLRARRTQSSSPWPARVLSALGFMRFVLPALLSLDPTAGARDNALDALRAFAVGGKWVLRKT
jgi:hypothetical protein